VSNLRPKVGFLIEHVAGWVTHYTNLCAVAEGESTLQAHWHHLNYYRSGGKLEALHEGKLHFVPGYIMGNLRFATEFSRALKAADYDALLTNSRVGGMLFARQLGDIPTIMEFDATPRQFDRMPAYGSPRDPPPIAYAKWRLHVRMYRSARILQAFSHWARRGMIEEYGVNDDKVVVNPPGVNLDFWQPSRVGKGGDNGRKVLFVGGDFRRKGGHLLLEWFRHQAAPDIELHVVTRESVPSAPKLFVYHDVPPNSETLRRLYREADVFVLPTLADCFGIVTVEAMASGLPVIMSDVGGYADMVENGANGFVIRSGDVREMGDAIASVLDAGSRRTAMGLRSRQLAEERFDLKRNASRTLGLLKDLANGERRAS
jgi:glycosyltransferase involved in cell wall biosynthesis